jgi:hypothetical protein
MSQNAPVYSKMWKLGSQRTSNPTRPALVGADHTHQIVGEAPRVEGQAWGPLN